MDDVTARALPQGSRTVHRADPEEVTGALRAAAGFSAYFDIDLVTGPGAGGDLQPVTDLYREPALLDAAVDGVAVRLGDVERRVAASTLHIGYAARLWSIALGGYAIGGVVPDLTGMSHRWPGQGPVHLTLAEPGGWRPADPADLATVAGLLLRTVVEEHLLPLHDTLRRTARLADGLLWGNTASALVGAVRVISGSRAGDDGAVLLAVRLLATPPLAGAARYRTDTAGRLVFDSIVRRSCCLYYRTPAGGTCGDCPLRGRAAVKRPAPAVPEEEPG